MLETERKVRPRLRAADVTTFYRMGLRLLSTKVLKHRGLVGKFINISNKQASIGKLIVSVKSVQSSSEERKTIELLVARGSLVKVK
jgi:hypothetical protein